MLWFCAWVTPSHSWCSVFTWMQKDVTLGQQSESHQCNWAVGQQLGCLVWYAYGAHISRRLKSSNTHISSGTPVRSWAVFQQHSVCWSPWSRKGTAWDPPALQSGGFFSQSQAKLLCWNFPQHFSLKWQSKTWEKASHVKKVHHQRKFGYSLLYLVCWKGTELNFYFYLFWFTYSNNN